MRPAPVACRSPSCDAPSPSFVSSIRPASSSSARTNTSAGAPTPNRKIQALYLTFFAELSIRRSVISEHGSGNHVFEIAGFIVFLFSFVLLAAYIRNQRARVNAHRSLNEQGVNVRAKQK